MGSPGDEEKPLDDEGNVLPPDGAEDEAEIVVVQTDALGKIVGSFPRIPEDSEAAETVSPTVRALIAPPPPKKTRKPRVSRFKPRTSGDSAANPIDASVDGPKLKQLRLTNRPIESAYELVEAVLRDREAGAAKALWHSVLRMSRKRAALHGATAGLVAAKSFFLLGPLGLLVAPIAMLVDRTRETRRVRAGKTELPEGKTEADMLTAPPTALMRASGSRKLMPWELRSHWMRASWRFFQIVRDFNARAEVVNDALLDATLSTADHQAAFRMAELLSKEFVRLEAIRRFLEEDLYGTNSKRPFHEMLQYDAVVLESDLFGTEGGRHPPIDWLILPHGVFTRRQLSVQLRRDLELIDGLRAADRDDVADGIKRLERADKTGRRKKLLPPPTDE